MMHEHDFELISAIAEGGLSPEKQAAAEASLASCQACRTDLQLQREARVFLRSAPPATMTDLERAALHRAVAAEIPPIARRSASRPTTPWFQRLMPAMAAAAALLVVVGIGSVLVNQTGNGDTAAETSAVQDGQLRGIEEAPTRPAAGADFDDAAESEFDDGAGASPTTAAALAPKESIVQEYGSISRGELEVLVGELGSTEESIAAEDDAPPNAQSLPVEPDLVCADTALEEGSITAIGRATVDGDDVEIYRIDEQVNVYSTLDCDLTASFK